MFNFQNSKYNKFLSVINANRKNHIPSWLVTLLPINTLIFWNKISSDVNQCIKKLHLEYYCLSSS